MATLAIKDNEATKDRVITDLELVLMIVKTCPQEMLFKIDINLDGIDPRFYKIADLVLKTKAEVQQIDPLPNLDKNQIEQIVKNLETFKDDRTPKN